MFSSFYYLPTVFPAPPVTPVIPTVTFPIPRQQFTITWNEPPLNMGGTIDAYFVNISGPNDLCGDVNTLQRVSTPQRVTERNYTCSGWTMPAGQKYTFTVHVQAGNCNGGNQKGPESDPITVCLQGMLYYIIITIVQSYTGKYHEFVAVCIVTSAQHE